jgi:hypothetical protein
MELYKPQELHYRINIDSEYNFIEGVYSGQTDHNNKKHGFGRWTSTDEDDNNR